MIKRNPFRGLGPLALAFVAFAALVLLSTLALAVYAAFFADLGALSRALQVILLICAFVIFFALKDRGGPNYILSLGLAFLEKAELADPKHRRDDDEHTKRRDIIP